MAIHLNSLYETPQEIERFFDDFFRLGPMYKKTVYPHVNIEENDEAYFVDINVPGIAAADVDLTLTARNLIIRGERTAPEGRYFRQERMGGSFQRVLNLNVPVDREKVSAKSENGIIRVTLPKSEGVKPRKIMVTE